jgi:hypothetical protein
MIDWVIPPQTAMVLYIYRVGRSCPARNPFTTRNSLGLLNSTRTRGPPVRPVRPTGQTGVAVAGSATGRPSGQTVSYGPPWAHYLGGYQDRLLSGPLGLLGLCHTAPVGVGHKDYGGEVLNRKLYMSCTM